ncbi:MAG: DUF1566 domain-containing protein, partial [Nitrospirae bacterium]|nr:DUF1566 domain-containing protein [Nitrospirota bacterium]
MKKLLTFLVMLITLCGISVSADAILIDRGNGMIYDTDLDITWLQNANYAKTSGYDSDGRMTWNEANIWANNLVYGGYRDWRLPTAFNQDGSGPCYGYNCTDSEIGHLYYISLGNVAGGPLTNIGPFINIPYDTVRLFSFWTSTPSATTLNNAWEFPFSVGYQYDDSIDRTYYGWAVHDSDVLAIPQLPQTGQTTCYDSTGAVIPCTGTGQDGDIKAGAPWPNPRFTDNGNGTVTDNLTGLMWTKDANLMYTRDPSFDTEDGIPGDGAVRWQKALDYVKKLNAESYLGYTDWRLSNIRELESLVNDEQSPSLWLEAQGFSNVQSLFYWSSTSDIGNASTAKVLFMAFGETNINDKSYGGSPYNNYGNYVWPVRSGQSQSLGSSIIQLPRTGQTTCYDSAGSMIPCAGTGQDGNIQAGVPWPDPRFTISADGYCVTDNLTSLMWVSSPDSVLRTWQQTLDYANDFTLCGYSDWRLPNRKELYSLIDFSRYNPALPSSHPFGNIQGGSPYWSSTSFASAPNFAWSIDIRDGSVWSGFDFYDKSYSGGVWPVRGGRAPILDPIGSKSVNEGVLLSFTVSGSDPDGDSLTFSASQLPSGATFDPSTRTFSWTPNYTQASLYSVTFAVSDGSLTDSETVTITVNDALPPDLIVSSLTAPATAVAGAAIGVSDTTQNQGTGTAGASTTKLYLSTNTTYDTGDIPLGNRPVPSLAPGATDSGTTTVVIPSQICGNTFYIIARADGDGVVIETSETNNNR